MTIDHLVSCTPYLSQKNLALALSVHCGIVKRLIVEELNLPRVNFKWVPHALGTTQELERVKISCEACESSKSSSVENSKEATKVLRPFSLHSFESRDELRKIDNQTNDWTLCGGMMNMGEFSNRLDSVIFAHLRCNWDFTWL
jgi:hypothetical protein